MRSTTAQGKFHGNGDDSAPPNQHRLGAARGHRKARPWIVASGFRRSPTRIQPAEELGDSAIQDGPRGALKRKWPKEVSLGEHTSLGPKSYCPDYRNLPVT